MKDIKGIFNKQKNKTLFTICTYPDDESALASGALHLALSEWYHEVDYNEVYTFRFVPFEI